MATNLYTVLDSDSERWRRQPTSDCLTLIIKAGVVVYPVQGWDRFHKSLTISGTYTSLRWHSVDFSERFIPIKVDTVGGELIIPYYSFPLIDSKDNQNDYHFLPSLPKVTNYTKAERRQLYNTTKLLSTDKQLDKIVIRKNGNSIILTRDYTPCSHLPSFNFVWIRDGKVVSDNDASHYEEIYTENKSMISSSLLRLRFEDAISIKLLSEYRKYLPPNLHSSLNSFRFVEVSGLSLQLQVWCSDLSRQRAYLNSLFGYINSEMIGKYLDGRQSVEIVL